MTTRCDSEATKGKTLCYYHQKVKEGIITPSSSAIEIQDEGKLLWTSQPKPY